MQLAGLAVRNAVQLDVEERAEEGTARELCRSGRRRMKLLLESTQLSKPLHFDNVSHATFPHLGDVVQWTAQRRDRTRKVSEPRWTKHTE